MLQLAGARLCRHAVQHATPGPLHAHRRRRQTERRTQDDIGSTSRNTRGLAAGAFFVQSVLTDDAADQDLGGLLQVVIVIIRATRVNFVASLQAREEQRIRLTLEWPARTPAVRPFTSFTAALLHTPPSLHRYRNAPWARILRASTRSTLAVVVGVCAVRAIAAVRSLLLVAAVVHSWSGAVVFAVPHALRALVQPQSVRRNAPPRRRSAYCTPTGIATDTSTR